MQETIDKNFEKNFFNKANETNVRNSVSKFYSIVSNSRKLYENYIFTGCSGKNILEYGCGPGSYAFSLAQKGAMVTGIDIADYAIKIADEKAKQENLSNIKFLVMDAENTSFDNNNFDLICGTGILHHLDMRKASSEISRILKKDGQAVFIEPMGYNPIINIYRKLTPKLRTKDEHPLKIKDIKIMKEYFNFLEIKFFHLTSIFSLIFKNRVGFEKYVNFFDNLDQLIFRMLPFTKYLSWQAVILLKHPKLD